MAEDISPPRFKFERFLARNQELPESAKVSCGFQKEEKETHKEMTENEPLSQVTPRQRQWPFSSVPGFQSERTLITFMNAAFKDISACPAQIVEGESSAELGERERWKKWNADMPWPAKGDAAGRNIKNSMIEAAAAVVGSFSMLHGKPGHPPSHGDEGEYEVGRS